MNKSDRPYEAIDILETLEHPANNEQLNLIAQMGRICLRHEIT